MLPGRDDTTQVYQTNDICQVSLPVASHGQRVHLLVTVSGMTPILIGSSCPKIDIHYMIVQSDDEKLG